MNLISNLKVLTSLTILILIPSLFGCVESSLCEEIESLRKSSGDKSVEFVLVKKSCGATTSNSEMLYIVQTGMDVDDQHPVLVMDRSNNLNIQWLNNKLLEVSYSSGRIFSFTNFWHSAKVDNFEYIVNISLRLVE